MSSESGVVLPAGGSRTKTAQRRKAEYEQEDSAEEILRRFDTRQNQMFPDDPTDERHHIAMATKGQSKFYDPCKLTSQMTLHCLERSRFNSKRAREECKEYFDAYKECKAEWVESLRRKRNGI
ncbi:hypothetical protein V1525DRAFT_359290 [Lipomyces kononenkoae]|uniref:Uncharacterized protein n=1 Tax=Lipomyces kononenkoae TaxID=34357 RepID=A0ACC3T2E4_LIPKO